MEKQKLIKEVFSDYNTESNIKEAIIKSLNLIKKVNVLEINIYSQSYIQIKELWFFEKFLKERFQFSNVDIKIKYSEEVTVKPIEKEWENLICYMIHKYPLMRPMILLKSTIEVNSKDILVKMKIKGADFLRGRKLDRELERVIYNLFGYKYKLDFIEVIDEKDELELAKKREFSKKQAIEKALEHMAIGEQIAEERTKKEGQKEGQKEPVPMSPEDKKNRYQCTPNDRTKIT